MVAGEKARKKRTTKKWSLEFGDRRSLSDNLCFCTPPRPVPSYPHPLSLLPQQSHNSLKSQFIYFLSGLPRFSIFFWSSDWLTHSNDQSIGQLIDRSLIHTHSITQLLTHSHYIYMQSLIGINCYFCFFVENTNQAKRFWFVSSVIQKLIIVPGAVHVFILGHWFELSSSGISIAVLKLWSQMCMGSQNKVKL